MAELLQKSAPAEPIRVCPACGDVLVAGFCPGCAPPPARLYAERGSRQTAVFAAGGRAVTAPTPVDSRRAASEWIVGPEEVDPQTRKAHPSQLRTTRPVDHELPEPVRKRTTQVYRHKSAPVAPLGGDAPRLWALPDPRVEGDAPQSAATARHARPVSPIRPVSSPVVFEPALVRAPLPEPALVKAPPEPAIAKVLPEPSIAKVPEPVELVPALETALPTERELEPVDPPHVASSDAPEDELVVPRPLPRAAWLLLAVGVLAGVVVALV